VFVDDAGFIIDLVDSFVERYAIDPGRVYIVGESNGAMMAQRLAFEHTDKFAAAASVIGAIPKNLLDGPQPSTSIPMLFINSENDPIVPWGGGDVRIAFFYLGNTLSIRDSIAFWVKNNGAATKPVVTPAPDLDPKDGTRVWRESYARGNDDIEVQLYRIRGAGHSWPSGLIAQDGLPPNRVCKDINASEVIWGFFRSKAR